MEKAKEFMMLHDERKGYLNAFEATGEVYFLELANDLLAEMLFLG